MTPTRGSQAGTMNFVGKMAQLSDPGQSRPSYWNIGRKKKEDQLQNSSSLKMEGSEL